MTIYNVKNPSQVGGTAQFYIRTYRGANVIDESLMVGILGFGGEIGTMTSTTVAVDSSSSTAAGDISKYIFSFRTDIFLPQNIYIKIQLPRDTFEVSKFPSCSSFPINGKLIAGTFTCSYNKELQSIEVRGIGQSIPANSDVGVIISMKNPRYSFITDTFEMYVMKEGTTLAFTRKLAIKGVPVTAGPITQISCYPLDSLYVTSKGKKMWFALSFKLTNPLNAGSVISIKLPSSMSFGGLAQVEGVEQDFYVRSGLQDISDTNPLSIAKFGTLELRISNFMPVAQPDLITIVMYLVTPLSSGLSTPIQIGSYTDSTLTKEIDKDVSQARINVNEIGLPSLTSITPVLPTPAIVYADGSTPINLRFNFMLGKTLAGSGMFKILIDERLNAFGVSNNNCKVYDKVANGWVNSPSCYKRDRDIFMKLSPRDYIVGTATYFDLLGVIKSPDAGGNYFFEVQMIDPLGKIQESFSSYFTFQSKLISIYTPTSVPREWGSKAVHEIVFRTPYEIPASKPQTQATDLVSYLKVTYRKAPAGPFPDPFFAGGVTADLGYGFTTPTRFPCKAIRGLNPVEGTNINCTLYPDNLEPYVIVQNYAKVPVNSNIEFYIPHKKNPPKGATQIEVKVILKQNRLLTISCFVATLIGFRDPAAVIDASVAGAQNTYTAVEVSKDFDISFNTLFPLNFVGNPNCKFLFEFPMYDVGVLPEEGNVACSLAGLPFNCYQFPSPLNWVYGSFTSDQTPNVLITHTWVIKNLRWPRHEYIVTAGGLPALAQILNRVYDANGNWIKGNLYASLNSPGASDPTTNPPKAATFTTARLNVDKKRRLEVDTTYTFTFSSPKDIPSGAIVTLTLPQEYNLMASYPAVQIIIPEFEDASPTQQLRAIIATANSVVISNVGFLFKNNEFRIILKGMRNPDIIASPQTPPCSCKVEYPILGFNMLVSYTLPFVDIALEGPFTAGKIDVSSISLFPINQNVEADYTFTFTPWTKLSIGAEIHIKFPAEYIFLPANPNCNVWGGLETFAICYKLVNEIVLRLDSAYNTGAINLKVKDIVNPKVATTSSIEIYTFYDGSVLDETKPDTAKYRKISLSAQASLLSMREFFFDPVNEGEVAKYTISFIPTNNILAGMNVYIKFPDTFDSRLGREVDIYVLSGLKGDVKISLKERVITISNFNKYDLSLGEPIKVELNGVINPNKPETGYSGSISVGTIWPGSNQFVDYLPRAGSISTVPAAGWLTLNMINATNYYSRSYADYFLNMTLTERIVKSDYGGKLIVDFPANYDVSDGVLKCVNQTANLGTMMRCSQEKRLVSAFGHPQELNYDTAFNILRVKNPLDEVTTDSFFVRTYDGFTREIVQRSFENLDPFRFTFTYPGPLIIINDGLPIYCERGTQTKDLYLVMTEIAALNLTFVPVTPGFSFVPNELKIYIGEIKVKFRVSIPMGFTEGEYEVEWITKGDSDPPIYTPIKKTQVVITGKGNIPIAISKVNDLAYRGNTLPIIFSTDYAPDIGIEVLVGFDKQYSGITLDKQSIQFVAGTNVGTVMVYFSDPNIPLEQVTQSGAIQLQLIGVNKDIYSLPTNTLTFNVINEDVRTPEITDMQLLEVTQTTAKIQFTCSDIATAYYVIALKGTALPSLEEMKTFGPAEFESTESVYGVYYVGQDQTGILNFEGLTAETPYVIHVLLEDRGFNVIQAPGYLEFTTKKRYNAAFVTVRFSQNYINSAERELISKKLAFLMSLNPWKVVESKYTYQQLQGRRMLGQKRHSRVLQTTVQEETFSLVTFTILAEPTSAVYPPPVELGKLLNRADKKQKVKDTFQNFDVNYNIVPIEFKRYDVGFSTKPQIVNVSFDQVNITCNLDNYGYIYAAAVRKDDDLGKPSSFQVARGLDYRNIPLPSNFVEIDQKFVVFSFTVDYLDSDTDYNLYMTAGSAHPGYPDLMPDANVIFLEFKTLKAPEKPKLSIESSGIFSISFLTLFLMTLFYLIIN